jgi:D-aminoacyl-tRNA deacylase
VWGQIGQLKLDSYLFCDPKDAYVKKRGAFYYYLTRLPQCTLLSQPKKRNMRAVIQRVKHAQVAVSDDIVAKIDQGLLILLGVEVEDTPDDADWLARKIAAMRIFSDADGHMNLSVQEVRGEVIVVSQFTLHANTKKGNRPSFMRSARPEQAEPLYKQFAQILQIVCQLDVKMGVFGADMQVSLLNDGPVTIWMDSKERE